MFIVTEYAALIVHQSLTTRYSAFGLNYSSMLHRFRVVSALGLFGRGSFRPYINILKDKRNATFNVKVTFFLFLFLFDSLRPINNLN